MIHPVQQFFLADSKIHTVASSACVLPPTEAHVYEVFRVMEGIPLFLEDHIERLQNSLRAASIMTDFSELNKEIGQLLALNKSATGNIRIVIWKAGEAVHRMLYYDKHQYPDEEMFQNGVVIGLLEHERKNPNVKFFDAPMRKEALQMMHKNNFYEILLVSEDKNMTECSRSNIFFIQDEVIITPPSYQVLEGVTRKHVIEIIDAAGFSLKEKIVSINELEDFQSVFLTGTSRRVLPVRRVDPYPKEFNTGHPLIRQLQELFLDKCRKYIALKKSF